MALVAQSTQSGAIVGHHPSLLEVLHLACRAARSHVPVLVAGETGTGKELLARYIHAQSLRAHEPFVVVDCGVLSQEVARSELFGHVRGAFTGAVESREGLVESVGEGTLFLDEVGELDASLQRQLLRLIQEGEFRRIGETRVRRTSIRLVAATNRNLQTWVREGRFREDLFFRLNVLYLRLPPLRERRSDVPLLVEHFLDKYQADGTKTKPISGEAMTLMERYHWPGNVRELGNVLIQMLVLTEGATVRPGDLPSRIRNATAPGLCDLYSLPYKSARRQSAEQFAREYMHRALLRTQGNVSRAAKSSGIGRQYFQMKMSELGLCSEGYRTARG